MCTSTGFMSFSAWLQIFGVYRDYSLPKEVHRYCFIETGKVITPARVLLMAKDYLAVKEAYNLFNHDRYVVDKMQELMLELYFEIMFLQRHSVGTVIEVDAHPLAWKEFYQKLESVLGYSATISNDGALKLRYKKTGKPMRLMSIYKLLREHKKPTSTQKLKKLIARVREYLSL